MRYEDPTVIRPHEQTLEKAIADRTALLEATRADLEPALILSEDGGRLDELLQEDLRNAKPLVRHRDSDGHFHVLYRIDDPARIALYRQALDVPSAIADGHHRYKVGQRYAAAHGAAADTAAGAKLAVITSLDSPALTIDPIHRAFKEPIDLARLAGVHGLHADVPRHQRQRLRRRRGRRRAAGDRRLGEGARSRDLAPQPHHRPRPGADRRAEAAGRDLPGDDPRRSRPPPEASTNGTVVYRSNPDELWNQVASGELGTGVWLPPMQPAAFAAAIAGGQMLPAKSTRFLPKVMSGLAWADHDSKVE